MEDRRLTRNTEPKQPTPGGAAPRRVPAWLGPIVGPIIGAAVAYYANRDSRLDAPEQLTWITASGAVVGFAVGCFVWIRDRRRNMAETRDAPPGPPQAPPSKPQRY